MASYVAYGLNIDSDLDLPELNAVPPIRADVKIRFGPVDRFAPNVSGRTHRAAHDEICFYYERIGKFRVRRNEIIVDLEPGADDRLLRVCLLGPGLAALLHQRGLLVLHGSAVNLFGTAVAFLGGKGWGKSTIAAFLQTRGHSFLADDVVALTTGAPDSIQLLPGFPQLKLWPDSVAYLGLDPEKLVCIQPDFEKRGHRVDLAPPSTPQSLGRIYVLDSGEQEETERIGMQQAVIELVRHSFLIRYLGPTGTAPVHLNHCCRVVSSVPAYYLRKPAPMSRLPELARLIEAHATQDI
jgi:hypothetical protein